MNFDEAIQTHSAWKLKLSNYLRKPDGSLKASDIQVDNKCPLGCWIYGEGTKWRSHPEYQLLKEKHISFHAAASNVVIRANEGKAVLEETMLGSQSDFAKASAGVVQALMTIKRKVG